MHAQYAKFIDRFVPPKGEKVLHLGRRIDDRRNYFDENYIHSPGERRNLEASRRMPEERRMQWIRMSQWRSRHV